MDPDRVYAWGIGMRMIIISMGEITAKPSGHSPETNGIYLFFLKNILSLFDQACDATVAENDAVDNTGGGVARKSRSDR